MKVVGDNSGVTVSAVETNKKDHQKRETLKRTSSDGKHAQECWNCGRKHEFHKRELCPAYGKTCSKCNKLNHFSAKCRGTKTTSNPRSIQVVDADTDEVFPVEVSTVDLDKSQFVTLKLESGNYLRFQVDTGAECNVIPLALYKKATKDFKLAHVTPSLPWHEDRDVSGQR